MKYTYFQGKCKRQAWLIQYLSIALVGLTLSVILLGAMTFKCWKHQRVILVPPQLTQPVSVSVTSVDANYLQAMGVFFAQLRLTTTPDEVISQQQLLMRYVDPSIYADFEKRLKEEATSIIKYKFNSVFFVNQVIPDPQHMRVVIKGVLSHWISGAKIKDKKVQYAIDFHYRHGQLFIKAFHALEKTA
jgi:conjugal transfer pilus assembly protein TraE